MTLAFVFPGQGARAISDAVAFAGALLDGPRLFEVVRAQTDLDPSALCARGGLALERTEVQQPVLVAISLAIAAELERAGLAPDVVLGHSLGELSAWCVAGAFSADTAIRLAGVRGRAMARAAQVQPGGLWCLPSADAVARAQQLTTPFGGVTVAAVNAPDEVLVAGSEAALRTLGAQLPGRRVPVSGPWHSPAMGSAEAEFRAKIEACAPRRADTSVISNRDGALAPPERCAEWLSGQLTRPVQLARGLRALAEWREPLTVVTVGPGAVLRALVRKNLGASVVVHTTENAADLARTCAQLRPR